MTRSDAEGFAKFFLQSVYRIIHTFRLYDSLLRPQHGFPVLGLFRIDETDMVFAHHVTAQVISPATINTKTTIMMASKLSQKKLSFSFIPSPPFLVRKHRPHLWALRNSKLAKHQVFRAGGSNLPTWISGTPQHSYECD
jgi:hypothetical protein